MRKPQSYSCLIFVVVLTVSQAFVEEIPLLMVRHHVKRQAPNVNVHDFPKTSFSCADKKVGEYYADPETRCQVYHICIPGTDGNLRPMSFACPNGTIFSQATRVCNSYEKVYCMLSTQFYEKLHGDIYINRDDYGDPSSFLQPVHIQPVQPVRQPAPSRSRRPPSPLPSSEPSTPSEPPPPPTRSSPLDVPVRQSFPAPSVPSRPFPPAGPPIRGSPPGAAPVRPSPAAPAPPIRPPPGAIAPPARPSLPPFRTRGRPTPATTTTTTSAPEYDYYYDYDDDQNEDQPSPTSGTGLRRNRRAIKRRPLLPTEVDVGRYPVDTNFTCYDKLPAFPYGDPEAECEVFHICLPITKGKLQDYKLFCPPTEGFNQETGICEPKGTFDCDAAEKFYQYNKFVNPYASRKEKLNPKILRKDKKEDRVRRQAAPSYTYHKLPKTSFSCEDKIMGGYYADPETDCQMFHICTQGATGRTVDLRFLCTNGTVFNQKTLVCESYEKVNCEDSENHYENEFTLFLEEERRREEEDERHRQDAAIDLKKTDRILKYKKETLPEKKLDKSIV